MLPFHYMSIKYVYLVKAPVVTWLSWFCVGFE